MIAREWQQTTLGQEVDLITGFPFQSAHYTTRFNGIRLLRGDNIGQGKLRWEGVKYWPASDIENVQNFSLRIGDVILAMDRPWIEAGLKYAWVIQEDVPSLLVQRVACLRARDTLDQRFLRYVIASREFTNHVVGIQTGTAVPHISGNQIKGFPFLRPPLPEQRAIAHILGTLDDKIEVNRRMNETLEGIARAIFRSWFVDFDPVRAKAAGREPEGMDAGTAALFPDAFDEINSLPAGWETRAIGDVVTVVGGSTPSTTNSVYWGDGFAFATPKDMSSLASPVLMATDRRITEAGLSQISSGLLPSGTVIMSSRAPIGYLTIAALPVAVNQGIIAMICDKELPNYYILLWAQQNMDTIVGHANGTTFPEISKRNFRPLSVIVPPSPILSRYSEIVGPLYEKITANLRENESLANLRDSLLPKLLSGGLRVGDALVPAEVSA